MKWVNKLTTEQKDQIAEKYKSGEYVWSELAEEYNVTKSSIYSIIKCRGISIIPRKTDKRTYTINRNYFDIIDTERKAYWLGLLYADGNNFVSRNRVTLKLQCSDLEILQKFNEDIGSNRPLSFRERSLENPNWQNQWASITMSKQFSESLTKLGCIDNKTFELKFPTEEQVPREFIRPMLRGYMDGDGWSSLWYTKKDSRLLLACGMTSTKDFCHAMKDFLRNELGSRGVIKLNTPKTNLITSNLNFMGHKNVMNFLDWLYKDAEIFLQRKYEKYIWMKEEFAWYKGVRRKSNHAPRADELLAKTMSYIEFDRIGRF